MKKLMNFSVDPYDLDKFHNDSSKLEAFMEKHRLDGLEMIQYANWNDSMVPSSLIVGNHTCFWPMWLDFWRGDQDALLRQFGSKATMDEYYCCGSKDELVQNYREQLRKASTLGVEYVLFHVSHVEIEHSYTYAYPYTDDIVADAFIDMMNNITDGLETDFQLLFENHWYPGLTFLDNKVSQRLMKEINYHKKGFVLDTGHLMNTNLELDSEETAVEYMLTVLKNMGDLKDNIKVIHLNSSLSGKYVGEALKNNNLYNPSLPFNDRYVNVYSHISKIDTHIPFRHPSICKVIDLVNPTHVVYEFAADSLDMLDTFISEQNQVLGL